MLEAGLLSQTADFNIPGYELSVDSTVTMIMILLLSHKATTIVKYISK
jgi:hypothetical protein